MLLFAGNIYKWENEEEPRSNEKCTPFFSENKSKKIISNAFPNGTLLESFYYYNEWYKVSKNIVQQNKDCAKMIHWIHKIIEWFGLEGVFL